MNDLIRYPDRPAWLAARAASVGGSDAPVILGLSPFSSPLALWSEKVGLVTRDDANQRLRIGHHVEGAILGLLAEEAGVYVQPERFALARHPKFPELTYSPDGLVYAPDAALDVIDAITAERPILGLAEVKNRAGFDAAADWTEEIPRDVFAQVQHGLDVTGLPAAWVGVLLQGREFRWAKVERDDVWIEEHRPALLDFVRRVAAEDPPAATGSESDRAALDAIYGVGEAGKAVALPPEAIDLALQYGEAAEMEARGTAGKKAAGNALREMLKDAEVGVLPGNLGKVTWKTQSRKAYMVAESSSRVLRVALKKDGA